MVSGLAIQRDVSFPPGASLLDHARGGIYGVQMESGGDLSERIDSGQDSFDPTFGELGLSIRAEAGAAKSSAGDWLIMAVILVILEGPQPWSPNG